MSTHQVLNRHLSVLHVDTLMEETFREADQWILERVGFSHKIPSPRLCNTLTLKAPLRSPLPARSRCPGRAMAPVKWPTTPCPPHRCRCRRRFRMAQRPIFSSRNTAETTPPKLTKEHMYLAKGFRYKDKDSKCLEYHVEVTGGRRQLQLHLRQKRKPTSPVRGMMRHVSHPALDVERTKPPGHLLSYR